jgi:hypothetical protein
MERKSLAGYTYCLNNPLSYTNPSGMLREPRPNPSDAGYPYNPEAVAWLANYYYQSMLGDGGDGVNTVTGFWDSHASTYSILGYRWEGDKRIDNATGTIIGVRKDGHYEKVFSQNYGTIHGKRLNNEKDPNLTDVVTVEYKWVWDVEYTIAYFFSTYGIKPRAGDNGFMSARNNDFMRGLAGFFDLLSITSMSNVPSIYSGATTGGLLTSAVNAINIISDMHSSDHVSLGDKVRLGFNAFLGLADAGFPFAGYPGSVLDSFGFFEFSYHQFDVYEATGSWVYYNWYSGNWHQIKLKK